MEQQKLQTDHEKKSVKRCFQQPKTVKTRCVYTPLLSFFSRPCPSRKGQPPPPNRFRRSVDCRTSGRGGVGIYSTTRNAACCKSAMLSPVVRSPRNAPSRFYKNIPLLSRQGQRYFYGSAIPHAPEELQGKGAAGYLTQNMQHLSLLIAETVACSPDTMFCLVAFCMSL